MQEVLACFPALDADLVEVLLSSTGGVVTRDVLESLGVAEQCVFFPSCGPRVPQGRVLVFSEPPGSVGLPSGASAPEVRALLRVSEFGSYRVGDTRLLAVSPTYEYATRLDDLFDTLFWAWRPARWSEELESALVQVMVRVEEDLAQMLLQMDALMSSMRSDAQGGMGEMLDTLKQDITKALSGEERSGSVGRIHMALHQVVMMSTMMPVPQAALEAFRHFESLKCADTPALEVAVQAASDAIDEYGKHAMTVGGRAANDPHIQHLLGVKRALYAMLQQPQGRRDYSPLWSLRSPASQVMSAFFQAPQLDVNKVAFWPLLSLKLLLEQPDELRRAIQVYSETLTGSVLLLGSLLPQWKVGPDVVANAQVLQAVLDCGMGYAGSIDGATVAIMGHECGCMELDERPRHTRLWKRVKDMARVLRKFAREKQLPLSLRINSDFEAALAGLQAHHDATTGSWVTANMAATWRHMIASGTLAVFELWQGEQLIAADFCHPIAGRAVYVATRFFEQSAKRASPGILLALVQMRHMAERYGVRLWDLGSTDANPIMAYKALISHVMERPHHRAILNRLQRETPERVRFPSDATIAIAEISPDHLLEVAKK